MSAPFSVIIPTLNAAKDLPDTFDTLLAGLNKGLLRDVIVSDGGSTDDTAHLADAVGATLISGPPGRGGQLARGAAAARGSWLIFLHADTHLPPNWPAILAAHAAQQPQKAAAFRLSFRSGGMRARATAGWANLRSRVWGLPYGDQALVISRAHYEAVGGFRDMPLMEDVDLVRRLRGQLRLLDEPVATSAARYEGAGWLRRGSANLLTLARYLGGADPEQLARRYYGR